MARGEKAHAQQSTPRAVRAWQVLFGAILIALGLTAAFGVYCVLYGLFKRPDDATVWIMAGNALIFCGLTVFLILLNFALSRANWNLAQTQGTHTYLAVNPSLVWEYYVISVDHTGQHKAALLNNSAAPAHGVNVTIWPLEDRQSDPGWQIGPGKMAMPSEALPFTRVELWFSERQPGVPAATDLHEGQELAESLQEQGHKLTPRTFVWRIEYNNALWQHQRIEGAYLYRIDVPPPPKYDLSALIQGPPFQTS